MGITKSILKGKYKEPTKEELELFISMADSEMIEWSKFKGECLDKLIK